jgi:hypothetical protein
MRKPLQYESLVGFAAKKSKVISIDQHFSHGDSKYSELSEILYREYVKINNIEVIYQIRSSREQKTVHIPKNANNFNGGSVSLPFKSSKVTLNTKVADGFYTNTWIALQNRNQYMPNLLVNGKKYSPIEVNGTFLKYQFHAEKSNSIDGKPENEVNINVTLNPIEHVNSIIGIWFG